MGSLVKREKKYYTVQKNMDNKTKGEKKKEQIESWKIEKERTVKKGEKEWKYER